MWKVWRQTGGPDIKQSEKLTWAFSSRELKSKSSQEIYTPGDGQPSGSDHAGWLKIMRKSKYISGRGETWKTVSTIDNGMRAKIPANSELEGTIMQLHPGAPPFSPNLPLLLTMKQAPTKSKYVTWPTTAQCEQSGPTVYIRWLEMTWEERVPLHDIVAWRDAVIHLHLHTDLHLVLHPYGIPQSRHCIDY